MDNATEGPFDDLPGAAGARPGPDEPPPGPDELRAIVARSGRHHRRGAAVGMAVTLIVGGAAGYLISGRSTAASTTVAVTGSPPTTSGVVSHSVHSGGASGAAGSSSYTPLFTRTAGRVTIRGFLTNFPEIMGAPARPPGCEPVGPPSFQAELSTEKMVGNARGLATADRTKPISAMMTTVIGDAEGDPTATVVVATGPRVAKVRVAFTSGATDDMTPVQGWVTLAGGVPGPQTSAPPSVGTLTAMDASGQVLSTQTATIGNGTEPPLPRGCTSPCPLQTTTTMATPAKGPTQVAPPAFACTGPPATMPGRGVPGPVPGAPPEPMTVPATPSTVVPSPPVPASTVPGK